MTRSELIALVPVRRYNNQPYFIALNDVPEPWRAQFAAALYGCACPVFKGLGFCAYACDWQRWVSGDWLGANRGPEGLLDAPAGADKS